jgi:catechol 2,3-dioxygenase-like lactoylglutathione lyase family enzyme
MRVPTPSGFASVSLPYRDREQAKMFYGGILGGELRQDGPILKYWFNNFAIHLGPQNGGGCPATQEWPHYAFTVTPDEFVGLIRRIDSYGIPRGEPWKRIKSKYSLMYFRDPSGNQWELYSPDGCDKIPLRIGINHGGDYAIDFPALSYDTIAPPKPGKEAAPCRPTGFNHMTLAVRDLAEAERFNVTVLGGVNVHPGETHITTVIGGCPVGWHQTKAGWTAPDAEYPHCTYLMEPEDLIPLKERLESFGVPTHDIATHDGVDAWMYFRDPSGNLWELNCPKGFAGAKRRDAKVDVRALCYDSWKDPGARGTQAAE